MPAFGLLLILLGIFLIINVFNGNIIHLAQNNLKLNFTSSAPPATSSSAPPVTPGATGYTPNIANLTDSANLIP